MINNLYLLNETITSGYNTIILDLLSIISIICAVSVIISKNPIISVLFLIGLFLTIASYLIIIGISFIGLSYLLVYVGAVSILFLFILMLINVRVSELLSETSNSIPLVFIIAFSFNSILSKLLPQNIYYYINNKILLNNYSHYLDVSNIYNNEDKLSFIAINT
jgi:NADH-ubiquinone oxidoreductase chain 6